MRLLKYGLFGLLCGQVTALWLRDRKYQKHIQDKDLYQKFLVTTKELVALNKELATFLETVDRKKTADEAVALLTKKEYDTDKSIRKLKKRSKS